mmetsp:Transcript_33934/g.85149  ORF Transcript_33934/g.85149 Transcript_33934/m.85149 type:complete len:494 (-) Transcript_33934:96-1577(-)
MSVNLFLSQAARGALRSRTQLATLRHPFCSPLSRSMHTVGPRSLPLPRGQLLRERLLLLNRGRAPVRPPPTASASGSSAALATATCSAISLLGVHLLKHGTLDRLLRPAHALSPAAARQDPLLETARRLNESARANAAALEQEDEQQSASSSSSSSSVLGIVWEVLKTAFMTVYVLPIRLLALMPCFAAAGLLGAVSSRLPEDGCGRRICLAMLRVCARAALFCCGFYYVRVRGQCAQPQDAPLLVANHVSFVDALLLVAFGGAEPWRGCLALHSPPPSFVAKRSVLAVPLIGPVAAQLGCVFVDRGAHHSRQLTRQRIVQRARITAGLEQPQADSQLRAEQQREQGDECSTEEKHEKHDRKTAEDDGHADTSWATHSQLAIFPEGTTGDGHHLLPFKSGAFEAGLPVQPLSIAYPHRCFNPAYWGEASPLFLVYRMLCQLYNSAEMSYLEVYRPSVAEQQNPRIYAENVRAVIQQELSAMQQERAHRGLRFL